MDIFSDKEVRQYWNENAEAWTALTRAGFDSYRNYLNTPAFLEKLPDVTGFTGIDIGCGEGYHTRLLVQRGSIMKGIDISEKLIQEANKTESEFPLGIEYLVGSATALPFVKEQFDFATSFMCLMDVPSVERAFREAFRVLKPDGFFQFSIVHPCFHTPYRKNLRNAHHMTYAFEVGNYFTNQNGVIEEWIFGDAPEGIKKQYTKFKVPTFKRTLTQWFMFILDAGFRIEMVNEPYPSDEVVNAYPSLQDAQIAAYFLHIRCRKPKNNTSIAFKLITVLNRSIKNIPLTLFYKASIFHALPNRKQLAL